MKFQKPIFIFIMMVILSVVGCANEDETSESENGSVILTEDGGSVQQSSRQSQSSDKSLYQYENMHIDPFWYVYDGCIFYELLYVMSSTPLILRSRI